MLEPVVRQREKEVNPPGCGANRENGSEIRAHQMADLSECSRGLK